MANKKIVEMPTANTLDGTEILALVQGGATKRATIDDVETRVLRVDSITSAMIQNGAVGNDEIANLSIAAADIAPDTITDVNLAPGAVDTSELAADSVDDTALGERMAIFWRRQGGNATDWGSSGNGGNTSYDMAGVGIRVQFGFYEWSEVGGWTSGNKLITFPVAFADQPIVLVTGMYPRDNTWGATKAAGNGTDVTVYWRTADGSGLPNPTPCGFYWVAIGPE